MEERKMLLSGIVSLGKGVDPGRVKSAAEKFGCPILEEKPKAEDAKYLLFDRAGVHFIAGGQDWRGDFSEMLPRVTGGHLAHEILLRATNQNPCADVPMRAVDATAGMGQDAFLLAARGYTVEMFEHNPITAFLLKDALMRAKSIPGCREIVSRMTLREGESRELLATLSYEPDLIYLDPMYPEKKKHSETKKKLQILHQIEEPCTDEKGLLDAAIGANPKRILIKRPADGPFLAGVKPSYSVTRTAVRFDCIVLGL